MAQTGVRSVPHKTSSAASSRAGSVRRPPGRRIGMICCRTTDVEQRVRNAARHESAAVAHPVGSATSKGCCRAASADRNVHRRRKSRSCRKAVWKASRDKGDTLRGSEASRPVQRCGDRHDHPPPGGQLSRRGWLAGGAARARTRKAFEHRHLLRAFHDTSGLDVGPADVPARIGLSFPTRGPSWSCSAGPIARSATPGVLSPVLHKGAPSLSRLLQGSRPAIRGCGHDPARGRETRPPRRRSSGQDAAHAASASAATFSSSTAPPRCAVVRRTPR